MYRKYANFGEISIIFDCEGVMAIIRLTAKFTNCAGMLTLGVELSNFVPNIRREYRRELFLLNFGVGHNEPEFFVRKFSLIIGEGC